MGATHPAAAAAPAYASPAPAYAATPTAAPASKSRTFIATPQDIQNDKAARRMKGTDAERFAPGRGQLALPFPKRLVGFTRRKGDARPTGDRPCYGCE